ncbi:hypothetical protein HWB26_gp33 [Lentibacter phage vB_LenP_ICBM2]|uniref:Spanin n=1 Tax=Lentibacter phage vB_LenP_ICBM2 TaxID=2847823 RepID=A0A3G2YRY5_9CAUD|nr:hypothetical protein HWB26_gp33 [Lentibacter phage vB_LenP_ICBM2]AYP28093.1 hypothetical protein vBLenPICBM2__33 [Lentibacter phage vB_LenP_ICBM2]
MKPLAPLTLILLLSGCLGNPLSLLGGGGPNVAANVQAGAENNQTGAQVGDITKAETVYSGVAPSGSVGSLNISNQDIPIWVILLLILGWVLPSPREIWVGLLKTITLGRYRG